MRGLAASLFALSAAACFHPTWVPVRTGAAIQPGTVVLVGSFTADPPIRQHGLPRECDGAWINGRFQPDGKVVFVQETDGNVIAFFTPDTSETWRPGARKPVETTDWTYMPLQGHFFVKVPRVPRVHLRSFAYLTNAGSRTFELPAQVEILPEDRVVYVGEIIVHRGRTPRAEIRNAVNGARKAARELKLEGLLQAPWSERLLRTTGSKRSLGEEWGDWCKDGTLAWQRIPAP